MKPLLRAGMPQVGQHTYQVYVLIQPGFNRNIFKKYIPDIPQ